MTRRAVQLGLRGAVLAQYAKEWIRRIEDITPLVREQHARLKASGTADLVLPRERPYPCPASSRIDADALASYSNE